MGNIPLERPKLKWKDCVKKNVRKTERYGRRQVEVARSLFRDMVFKTETKKREERREGALFKINIKLSIPIRFLNLI